MADPLSDIAPGAISPFIKNTDTNNLVLDAVRRFRREHGNGRGGTGPVQNDAVVPACLVWVRNDTGASLLPYGCASPSGAIVDPGTYPEEARAQPALAVTAPAAATSLFVVPIDPIEAEGFGRAAVAGVTVAAVNVTDLTHRYAVPVAGTTTSFASAAGGPVRLLHVPILTGVQNLLVRLAPDPAPSARSCVGSNVFCLNYAPVCIGQIDLPGRGFFRIAGKANGYINAYPNGFAYLRMWAEIGGVMVPGTDTVLAFGSNSTDYGSGSFEAHVTIDSSYLTVPSFAMVGQIHGTGVNFAADGAYFFTTSMSATQIPALEANGDFCSACTPGSSGSSGGGGDGVSGFTDQGSGSADSVGDTATVTLAGKTVLAGHVLWVAAMMHDTGGTFTATFNGATMAVAYAASLPGAGAVGTVRWFKLRLTADATGDVVVSYTRSPMGDGFVLLASALDVAGSDGFIDMDQDATGAGTAPNSGAVTTRDAPEALLALAAISDGTGAAVTAGTWGGGFTSLHTVGPSSFKLQTAYQLAPLTGTFTASMTGTTPPGWRVAVITST